MCEVIRIPYEDVNFGTYIGKPIEYDEEHYYLGNPRNHRIIKKDLYNKMIEEFMKGNNED